MPKVINVQSKEEMLKIAADLIQKADPGIEDLVQHMLPAPVKKVEHEKKINQLQAFMDNYNNLEYDHDRHVAKTLTDLSEKCLQELTTANGTYVAEIMAYNMIDMEIDGVKFNVPQSVRNELYNSAEKTSEVSSELNRELGVYLSALDAVINGTRYSYHDMETSYSGFVTADEYDDFWLDDWEDYKEESNKYLEKAAEAMGKGYESYADGKKYKEFSGKRAYREATLRVNMHTSDGLTKENYAERLGQRPVSEEDVRWAKDAVQNMLKSFYGRNEYNDNMQFLDCVYVDGVPASLAYNFGDKDYSCCMFMKDVLDGGHQFAVRDMTREDGELKPMHVIPSLVAEEKFSIWRAILRFFGIELKSKTKKFEEAVQFNQLLDDDIVESIKHFDYTTYSYADSMASVITEKEQCDQMYENIENYCFLSNFDDPGRYFSDHTKYYKNEFFKNGENEFQRQEDIVKTMGRATSRGSLAATYMLSKGMNLGQLVAPSEEDKRLMKEYGREFVDKFTVPTHEDVVRAMYPNYSSKAVKNALKTDELARQRYEEAVEEKLQIISETYAQLTDALQEHERNLPHVDYDDNMSIAKAVIPHSLFTTASCDLYQSMSRGILDTRKDANALRAGNYGYESQHKSIISKIATYYASPALSTVFSTPSTVNNLLNALVLKDYCSKSVRDEHIEPNGAGIVKKEFRDALVNIFNEMDTIKGTKEQVDVIEYAKKLVCGDLPLPKSLIDANGESHLLDCFKEYKNPTEPQKQAQRTNTI